MKPTSKVVHLIEQHIDVVKSLIQFNVDNISALCDATLDCLKRGGKVVLMGNGGSAADSQHLAAEFIGRYVRTRRALPAIALTTDTSIITSIGNDFGFDQIFERQIAAICTSDDLVIGISTSGNSGNVIRAIEEAKKRNILTAGFLGADGGKLAKLVDIPIVISSPVTARVQEAHILIGHIICEHCDEYFASNN